MTAPPIRGRPKGTHNPRSIGELGASVFRALEVRGPVAPLAEVARYRADPVLYARERLGLEYLPHQAGLAYAIAGQWDRITQEMVDLAQLENLGKRKIACSSGQKTGKTLLIVGTGLWFYECFTDSQALVTAAKGEQIRAVVWRELDRVLFRAPHRPEGNLSTDPARGMLSRDRMRAIRGFTGRSVEALAGVSGNLLYAVDEASHLEQDKAEAVEGNTGGAEGEAVAEADLELGYLDCPILYTSQPTRPTGPFFDAFHEKREFWTRSTLDAEMIAKWCAARGKRVRGIHTLHKVEQEREEYGEQSPFFLVRVKGAFLRNETGRINSLEIVEQAVDRWDAAPVEGRLVIGYDPAGPGVEGDEHGFAAVRGARAMAVLAERGLSEDGGVARALDLVKAYRLPGDEEMPLVIVDADGVGNAHYHKLRAESEIRRLRDPANAFAVVAVRSHSKTVREPLRFAFMRDEIYWHFSLWLRTGAIPDDAKLQGELLFPKWVARVDGKMHATPKDDFRDTLKRSPDRADALMLAVWNPRVYAHALLGAGGAPPAPTDVHDANAPFYASASDPFGNDDGGDQGSPFWPKG